VGERAAHDDDSLEALRRRFSHALPADHLGFFRSLSVAHDEGGYRFVHAGVRPGVPLSAQSDADQLWIRRPFLESERDHGAVVVHGHSIAPEVQVRRNRIGIDTGAYRSGVLTCLVLEGASRVLLQTVPEEGR
jgi:serine/threonine protein phosphatase 1